MLNVVFSPQWFYFKDIAIDIISVLVLLLIGYCCWQYHRLDKTKKYYSRFSLSFLMIAGSFLFKIFTYFTLYREITQTRQVGLITLTYNIVQTSDALLLVGTIISRFLMLLGLYLLFTLYYPAKQRSTTFFMAYLLLIVAYLSHPAYYVFHLTAFLFLLFIISHYYHNYHKTKDQPAHWLFYSFLAIGISQLLFIFIKLDDVLYVGAEAIQLLGYLLLLISFLMVRYGKKK